MEQLDKKNFSEELRETSRKACLGDVLQYEEKLKIMIHEQTDNYFYYTQASGKTKFEEECMKAASNGAFGRTFYFVISNEKMKQYRFKKSCFSDKSHLILYLSDEIFCKQMKTIASIYGFEENSNSYFSTMERIEDMKSLVLEVRFSWGNVN